jgi:muramoyltetrapeptide carboxypeptidase LdcA involved in peptidoglycan recycling
MVRTAIGSRLLTGGCLGTGAMIAHSGFVPKFVPRLMFLTDAGAHPYDLEKYFLTLRRMMARRHVELAPAVEARLRALTLH